MRKIKFLKRTLCLFLTITTLFSLSGCTSQIKADDLTKDFSSQPVDEKSADESFTTKQMDFALKLFQNTVKERSDNNILVSPLSVMLALSMAANGADTETRSEMEHVLAGNFSIEELNEYLHTFTKNLPSSKYGQLHIANSIWLRDDEDFHVNHDFLQTCSSYYDAQIYQAAFDQQTLKDINNWAAQNTDNMIKEVLQEIPDGAIMYLINALAFDAEWETIYQNTQILDDSFTSIQGKTNPVEMMYSSEYTYLDDRNATGFLKNYKDGSYQFAALLPNEDIDIYEYIESLNFETLTQTIQNASNETVYAAIPKFIYDFSIELNDILKTLGMPSAFDLQDADFTNLGTYSDQNIYISNVLHKTFISVDEKGTKAGAVTVTEFDAGASLSEPKKVILNRPFVYMIIDGETKLPVFIGAVMDLPAN